MYVEGLQGEDLGKSRRAPSRFGVLGGEASVGDVDMVLTSQCQPEWCSEQSNDQKTTIG